MTVNIWNNVERMDNRLQSLLNRMAKQATDQQDLIEMALSEFATVNQAIGSGDYNGRDYDKAQALYKWIAAQFSPSKE